MNRYYADQAEQHARRNPNDAHAQALWAHWIRALAQIDAQRMQSQQPIPGMAAAAAPPAPPVHGGFPMPPMPSAVPSQLPGAEAPTPPASQAQLPTGTGHAQQTNTSIFDHRCNL